MNQEKEFYKELDKSHKDQDKVTKKKKDRTLSAWSLAVFFIVLIALCEGIVFYLGNNLKIKPDTELTSSANVLGGLGLVTQPDFSSDSPIYVPEGLLCSKLAVSLGHDVKCSITDEAIQVSGKISGLLPANASAFFVPKIEGDSAKLELKDIKIGNVSTFKFLGSPLNPIINSALKASVATGDFKIKRIDLETAVMVIVVSK